MSEFSDGDEVVLKNHKAGQPTMIVVGAEPDGKLACCYYEGSVLRRASFPAKALKKFEPAPPQG